MAWPPAPPHLGNHHRATIDKIFEHPAKPCHQDVGTQQVVGRRRTPSSAGYGPGE